MPPVGMKETSGIGAETGLNVISIQLGDDGKTNPPASTVLPQGAEIVMLGTAEQYQRFRKRYR